MHAPSPDAPFRKRTFSLPQYARSLAAVMTASPVLVRALIRPRISPALREQVMLAVTSVNDCRYCHWGHTVLARRHGVDVAALRQTLGSGSLSADSTPDEVAIWYAQHVASKQGDADPGAERALAAAWTPAEQAEIKAYITAITFGNLVGNSADAWLARLRRIPVEGGHPAGEAIAALAGFPALLSVWAWSRRPGSEAIDAL
jgi:AhpD family alkylhydroperoxidase